MLLTLTSALFPLYGFFSHDIKIYGDFFGSGDVKDVEDALRGLKYDVSTIKETLGKLDLNKYFFGIDAEDVKELISTQQ